MQFNLELFKQVVETDLTELENFRAIYDKFLDSVEDEYLETVFYEQLNLFIRDYCNGIEAEHNFRVFMSLIVSKYCYEQGLKDGKGN